MQKINNINSTASVLAAINITYEAGDFILLQNGFTADVGGRLWSFYWRMWS